MMFLSDNRLLENISAKREAQDEKSVWNTEQKAMQIVV